MSVSCDCLYCVPSLSFLIKREMNNETEPVGGGTVEASDVTLFRQPIRTWLQQLSIKINQSVYMLVNHISCSQKSGLFTQQTH